MAGTPGGAVCWTGGCSGGNVSVCCSGGESGEASLSLGASTSEAIHATWDTEAAEEKAAGDKAEEQAAADTASYLQAWAGWGSDLPVAAAIASLTGAAPTARFGKSTDCKCKPKDMLPETRPAALDGRYPASCTGWCWSGPIHQKLLLWSLDGEYPLALRGRCSAM
jgi:hypothetical protein